MSGAVDSKSGFTFTRAAGEEVEVGKICSVYDFEFDKYPLAYGQLKTLFGEADFETDDVENQYRYVLCATGPSGRKHVLDAYSGPSGPSIGGAYEGVKAAEALVELIRNTEPTDYAYEGYYMDAFVKVMMGVKDGQPYYSDVELSEDEVREVFDRWYGKQS